MSGFPAYAFEQVAAALSAVPAAEARDAYVVSLLVYDETDDPRHPTLTVGFNTESRVSEMTPRAFDAAEARWNARGGSSASASTSFAACTTAV